MLFLRNCLGSVRHSNCTTKAHWHFLFYANQQCVISTWWCTRLLQENKQDLYQYTWGSSLAVLAKGCGLLKRDFSNFAKFLALSFSFYLLSAAHCCCRGAKDEQRWFHEEQHCTIYTSGGHAFLVNNQQVSKLCLLTRILGLTTVYKAVRLIQTSGWQRIRWRTNS